MRLWLWIAFVVCLYAHPAHAVTALTCPGNESTYPSTSTAEAWCPPRVTLSGTTHTNSAITVSGTSTHAEGTVFGVVRTACATNRNWRNIADRVGETWGTTTSFTGSSWSITFTGLAAATEYCVLITQTADGKPSPVQDVEVETDASAGGGGGAGAEITGGDDYFAGVGGSDAASGLTHANRWANPPSNDATIGANADMWLYTGSVWEDRKYTMNRAGSSGNWAESGCYYMDSTTPRNCIRGTHTLPEFRGGLTVSCLTAHTCNYMYSTGANNLNSNNLNDTYDSYLRITSTADYHRIAGIRVNGSQANGIYVEGSFPTMGSLEYVIVEDMEFENIGGTAFIGQNGVRNIILRDSFIGLYGTCAGQRQAGGSNISDSCPGGSGFPAGGIIIRSTQAYALIENNEFYRGAGEGFDCAQSTSYVIMRGNRLAQTQSAGFYPDGCNHVVVENNIAVGPKGEDFGYYNGSGTGFGGSPSADIEDWQGASAISMTNLVFRNNLSVQTGGGIVWGLSYTAQTYGKQIGGYIIGNTMIDALDDDIAIEPTVDNADIATGIYIHNNAGWNQTNGAAACTMGSASEIIKTHNHAYTSYTDTDCNGTNQSTGAPSLSVSTYATWQAYNYASMPTFANARPNASSPLENSGTAMTSTILTYADYGWAATQMADILSGAITSANWEKALYYDALNAVRGASPEKGAVER